jgi:hypothetical protein
MKHLKKRPSPAMIVAMTALCVSLVGTAFAGPIAEISGLNKRDKRVIRKITRKVSGKVSNRRITKRAPGLSVAAAQNANIANVANAANSAVNAQNAQNAQNAEDSDQLGSLPPSAYARSTVLRSVAVLANGSVVSSSSDGVAQSNVTHPSTGVYCVDGLNPAPKTAIGTSRFGSGFKVQIFTKTNPGGIELCPGKQIGVAIYNEANALSNQPFQLLIH